MSQDAFDEPTFSVDESESAYEPQPDRPQRSSGCLLGCLLGCGGLFLLAVIAIAVLGYFFQKGMSSDPVKVRGWLQDAVRCKIPEGYDAKFGFQREIPVVGKITMVMIVPEDVQIGKKRKPKARPDKGTMFIIFGAQGMPEQQLKAQIDAQMQQPIGGAGDGTQSKVELQVGDRTVTGTKIEAVQDGKELLEYVVMLKPGVMLTAIGPREKFDEAAFKAFLKSVEADDEGLPAEREEFEAEKQPAKPAPDGAKEEGAEAGPPMKDVKKAAPDKAEEKAEKEPAIKKAS